MQLVATASRDKQLVRILLKLKVTYSLTKCQSTYNLALPLEL